MRTVGVVLGGLVLLIGLVWVGQGLGYIHGSFMTGVAMWAWIGAACVLAGLVLMAAGLRRSRTG